MQPTLFEDELAPPAADGKRFYDDDYRDTLRAILLAKIARGCYEPPTSKAAACFSIKQAKATKCRPASVLG